MNQIKKLIEKYCALALISARSNFAYFSEILSRQLFLAAILYIFLRLWQQTYSHTGLEQMAGLSLAQMLWYLTATEAIILSSTSISTIIDEEVRSGSLAIQLIRPTPYPIYRLALYLGERYTKLFANLLTGSFLCFILVQEIPITFFGILALAIALPLSLALDFLGNFIVGLSAFWLENTSGVLLIYSRLTMILGGMLIPLDLLPAPYAGWAKCLPFASMIYAPARQFVRPCAYELIQFIALQVAWILLFSLFVLYIYRLALSRVASNGG